MTIKYVDIEALNFRSAPIISAETVIGILHLGQKVEENGSTEEGWLNITATINGSSVRGAVKSNIDNLPTLRNSVSDERETLVTQAIQEWLRFEQGQGLEHHDPFYKFVGNMWSAIGQNLDGRDRDIPWSAAAISFMVRNASNTIPKYGNFKFAPAHSRYLHDSIIKRRNQDVSAPFWGFRLHEQHPQIGDIVARWRETPRDFDDAESSDSFKSHCDIIVSVHPNFVLAIGGNVDQSVNITRYAKTGAGFLAPRDSVFMHMVNQC